MKTQTTIKMVLSAEIGCLQVTCLDVVFTGKCSDRRIGRIVPTQTEKLSFRTATSGFT